MKRAVFKRRAVVPGPVYAENDRTEEARRDEEKDVNLVYIPGHLSPFDWQKNSMNDDPTLQGSSGIIIHNIDENVNLIDEFLRILRRVPHLGVTLATSWSAERRSLVENGLGRRTAAPSMVSPSFPPVTITLRDGFAL